MDSRPAGNPSILSIDDVARAGAAPRLELVQGTYYFVSGMWSLVSPRTFQAVTGKKRDMWLAKTIGLLLSSTGAVFLYSGLRRRRPTEIVLLAIGMSATLATSALVWGTRQRRIYAADAAVQLALLASWLFGRGRVPWPRPTARAARDSGPGAALGTEPPGQQRPPSDS
ncbi:MAG TPA: hypothetical protein VE987_00570 [Polyangiaceae bacterium]|nr:hypothetical protein [Polyangiaceae bacterium]